MNTYTRESMSGVWLSQKNKTFGYTDGCEVESRLLAILKEATDVSASSPQLAAAVSDWPSEYHLSPARHNLLRPFAFAPAQRVLELGCGCGAMTRYLGETGATIIAVEGSQNRAAIAAERCRDLPNVEIYCDNLIEFQSDEKFDYVTLIGVLEYAPKYIDAPDPVGACLEHARSFLKDNGAIILAIENQLGLKYFCGCSEDHIGVPYFGVHGLYGKGDPTTFGRRVLSDKLRRAGFTSHEFYYPFPDYKLPDVILSEEGLVQENFRSADMLYRIPSRDNGGTPWRTFHENLAWQTISRNGLLGELANSFLVVASNLSQRDQARWLAYVFSTRRLPIFATETTFKMEDDAIVVTKNRLFPNLPASQEFPFRHHPPLRAGYVTGKLYAIELQRIMAKAGSLDDVAQWVAPWLAHLQQRADSVNSYLLPGECLDVIPANLVLTPEGTLVEIDAEWSAKDQIPMSWVLIRGLVNAFASSPRSPVFSKISYREAVERVLGRLNYTLSDQDFQEAAALEDNLQRMVNGSGWKGPLYGDLLSGLAIPSTCTPIFGDLLVAKQLELDHAHKEIARVKSTVSWQITKPLRFVWNTLRQIFSSSTKS